MNHNDIGSWIALIEFLLLLGCVAWFMPRALLSLSHNRHFVPDPFETPDGFYAKLHAELAAMLPEAAPQFRSIGFGPRKLFQTRTIFGRRPVYLAIRYREFTYYVYAVPTLGGLAVSQWLFSAYSGWDQIPWIAYVLNLRLLNMTIFQVDALMMFHDMAESAVNNVVNEYRANANLRPLEEQECRPVLQGYYARLRQGSSPGNDRVFRQRPAPDSLTPNDMPRPAHGLHPAGAEYLEPEPAG